jgi:hypothetical protein
MSADVFCDLVESTLLEYLPGHLRRPDSKLTPSERSRATTAFNETWDLAYQLSDPNIGPIKEAQLKQAPLPNLLRIKEIAIFLYTNITKADREKIASGPQTARTRSPQETTGDYDDDRVIIGFSKILSIFVERIEKERNGSYNIPDYAPLNLFSFFDQWQSEVEECVPINT